MRWFLFAVSVLLTVSAVVTVTYAQIPSTPPSFARPDQARFRLLAEEGILNPDGRLYISGGKVWAVADKSTGQCFMLFVLPGGASVTGPITCP